MLIGAIAKTFGDVALTEICQLAFIWSVITSKFFVVVGSFVCFVLLHIDDQGSICDRPSPDAMRLVVN